MAAISRLVAYLSWITMTAPAAEHMIFTGSYTNDAETQGICMLRFDDETGKLSEPVLAAPSESPSFLAIDRSGQYLYAVNEPPSTVTSWRVEAGGKLVPLSRQPVADGDAGPCHLTLGPDDRCLVVANYGGGSVSAFPVEEDGRIRPRSAFVQHTGSGPDRSRQEKPHAHGAHLSPDGQRVLVPDLGIDRVVIYRLDGEAGKLEATSAAGEVDPGSGPRHGVFHPERPLFFCINELSSTITTFRWDAEKGTLTRTGDPVSTLPPDFKGSSTTAEIAVHPNGRFVYGSNRGHDSIAVFHLSGDDRLEPVQHVSTGGRTPRHFALDPTGRWLIAANQDSGNLRVFSVDPEKGTLTPAGGVEGPVKPVCIVFVPAPH